MSTGTASRALRPICRRCLHRYMQTATPRYRAQPSPHTKPLTDTDGISRRAEAALSDLQTLIDRARLQHRDRLLTRAAHEHADQTPAAEYEREYAALLQPAAEAGASTSRPRPLLPASVASRMPNHLISASRAPSPTQWVAAVSSIESFAGLSVRDINQLLHAIPAAARPELAADLQAKMREAGMAPTALTYDLLMDGYADVGDLAKCIALWQQRDELLTAGVHAYAHLLKAVSRCRRQDLPLLSRLLGDDDIRSTSLRLPVAMRLLDRMRQGSVPLTTPVMTTVMHIALQEGAHAEVHECFAFMKLHGGESLPDTAAYNQAICACIATNDAERALDLLRELQQHARLRADSATYAAVMAACARRPEFWSQAYALAREARDAGLRGDMQLSTALLRVCAFAGDVARARQIVRAIAAYAQADPLEWSCTPQVAQLMMRAYSMAPVLRGHKQKSLKAGGLAALGPGASGSGASRSQTGPQETRDESITVGQSPRKDPFSEQNLSSPALVCQDAFGFWEYLSSHAPDAASDPHVLSTMASIFSNAAVHGGIDTSDLQRAIATMYPSLVDSDMEQLLDKLSAHNVVMGTSALPGLYVMEQLFDCVYARARTDREVLSPAFAGTYWSYVCRVLVPRAEEEARGMQRKRVLQSLRRLVSRYVNALARVDRIQEACELACAFAQPALQPTVQIRTGDTFVPRLAADSPCRVAWRRGDLDVLRQRALRDEHPALQVLQQIIPDRARRTLRAQPLPGRSRERQRGHETTKRPPGLPRAHGLAMRLG